MEYEVLPNHAPWPHLVASIYFVFTVCVTSFWFFYTESELDQNLLDLPLVRALAVFPLVAMLILLIVNCFTSCVFYFDENRVYHRGGLSILAFTIPCLYMIVGIIHSLSRAFRRENYVHRRAFLDLAIFAFLAFLSAALQFVLPGTPLPSMGITLASFMIYLNSQELLVSQDPLTKLNNRYQMVQYLSHKIEHKTDAFDLFLLLIDLDRFKQINDTYGHVEGDQALIRLAGVLKKTATAFNCFVARYGGDEFVIIYDSPPEGQIDEICCYLQAALEESNRCSGKDYELQASIGHARYESRFEYIPEFIAQADQSLYQIKHDKKQKRLN